MKHGKGRWRKNDENPTNVYTGEYREDLKHGSGEYVWASGNKYSGNYKEDEREGHGEMIWTD